MEFSSNHTIIYKGIDIGVSREVVFDFQSQTGIEFDESMMEMFYNQHLQVVRDRKIEEILG